MNLTLIRFAYLESCTLGWLHAGALELATIERPWVQNPAGQGGLPEKSCVPDGRYLVRPHSSDKFPNTYALVNNALGVYYQPFEIPVGQRWGRSAILIHVGNFVGDVIGCIAVGTAHTQIQGVRQVVASKSALELLRAALRDQDHTLDIRAIAGTQETA